MITHLLYETPSGYALFQRGELDEIAQETHQVQSSLTNLAQFGKALSLMAFYPFKSANDALENMNDVSEGIVHDSLKSFLELNLPRSSSSTQPIVLGVLEKTLAGSIKSNLGIECESNEIVHELGRAVRHHADKVLKPLNEGDLDRAYLGLGHAYSQAKLKYNVHKSDNMIIQAVGTVEQVDKDVNTFSMRVREWYSWHFPELSKLVSDPLIYAKLVKFIGDRHTLFNEARDQSPQQIKDELTELVNGDEHQSQQILDAATMSMGTAISIVDLQNVILFADRVISLLTYRHSLHGYLKTKMQTVAPNMTELLGEMVGAKLISHAGSLTNLSKYPASTVQLLGAEKALFRALKTKSNTPKFGILYHASYLGKVGSKHKGRMARMVANKCAMASRVDAYMDPPEEQPLSTSSISSSISNTSMFGKQLKLELEKVIAKYEGKSNSLVSNPTLSTSRTTSTTSKLSKATTTSTFKKSHLPKSKVVSRVH